MAIGLSGVQFRSNRVSDFKFEITSRITPEFYDTESYYQLIVSVTKCEKLRNEIS